MIWRCDLVSQYEAYRDEISEAIQRVLRTGCYILASGHSAALIAALGLGLVPVVNTEADMAAPGIAIMETSVSGVRDAVRHALALPPAEVAALGRRAIQSYHQLYTPERFCASFRDVIRQVTMSHAT